MHAMEVKARSEAIIAALGGKTLDSLPVLDRTTPRESPEIASRALVTHALFQLTLGAPINVIAAWIRSNQLQAALSLRERTYLDLPDGQLTDQDRGNLQFYIEALWAFAWAGQLAPHLAVHRPVGDTLAALLPDIRQAEDATRFRASFTLRTFDELYQMLDLYYRAHWFARDGQLRGYSTGVFDADVIMERRKALEWIADRTIPDWDATPDST